MLKVTTLFDFLLLMAFLLTVFESTISAEDCGQEELALCAKPLQALHSTTDLSFAPKREELDKLCPDLNAGLNCIRSYTRRCMTLTQRDQFNRIYQGTNEVIKDLCREGEYQDEFLRHSPCLQTVKPQHELCAVGYQQTMASIFKASANQTTKQQQQQQRQQSEQSTEAESESHDDGRENVKIVCCSFKEYLDCSELVTRQTCGAETGHFIREFLHKMSDSLMQNYCEKHYKGSNQCFIEIVSSAPSLSSTIVAIIFLQLTITQIS